MALILSLCLRGGHIIRPTELFSLIPNRGSCLGAGSLRVEEKVERGTDIDRVGHSLGMDCTE